MPINREYAQAAASVTVLWVHAAAVNRRLIRRSFGALGKL